MRLAVQRVQLARRIETLKMQEGEDSDHDIPQDAHAAADQALSDPNAPKLGQGRLSRALKADIFREIVLAKTREMRQQAETEARANKRTSISNAPPQQPPRPPHAH